MFVVFEGGDGSGKTSAIEYVNKKVRESAPCEVLNDWFNNSDVKQKFVTNSELTDTDRLTIINYCRGESLFKVNQDIDLTHILYDRFILSTYAYQSTMGIGKLPVLQVAQSINKNLITFPHCPVFVIMNGVDYETQQQRVKQRNNGSADVFDYMSKERYNKLQDFFKNHAKNVLTLHYRYAKIITINNTGSLDELYKQLDRVVEFILREQIGESYEG